MYLGVDAIRNSFRDRRLLVTCSEYRAYRGRPDIPPRRGSQNGHSFDVEKRSVKVTKAVEQHQFSHRSLGRKEQRRSSKETAHVCKRESQNSEGAKGAVGEGESHEEECLTEARGKGSPHYLIP